MKILLSALIGYFLGSVPFALVIGKIFYKTDVRKYGSGNPGGGNTGRVLGKRAGVSVMTMDILKVAAAVFLARLIGGSAMQDLTAAAAGIAAGIGHCYPVFAGFRGGKAVAPLYGFLFGMVVFAGRSPLYFLVPLCIFMIVLVIGRMTSLSSMVSSVAAAVLIFLVPEAPAIRITVIFYAVLIVIRHRANIDRIREHRENRISWLPG